MEKRIQELIEQFQLIPHPEGGFYREMYRSEGLIENKNRNYLTSIYFLVTNSNISRFHRIQSDECWYFHEGSPLRIHSIHPDGTHTYCDLGLDFKQSETPFHVVKAQTIFGSLLRDETGYAFVSCAVAPGFSFEDFELFSTHELTQHYPAHTQIIEKLT